MSAGGITLPPGGKTSTRLELTNTTQRHEALEMDSLDSNRLAQNGDRFVVGYQGIYLGFVPSFKSSGEECIYYCVEKILDACNAREALMKDSFVDIQSSCVKIHFVDERLKVLNTKIYDLARISYCCSNHSNDSRIFSWIYKQEIDVGFQLECHAVRFPTEKKASLVASKLFRAFNKLYSEVQNSVTCSSMLTRFRTRLGSSQNEADGKKQARSSPRKSPRRSEKRSGSYVDNLAFENIDEHCMGVEYDTDSVFIE
jgi:hypothetical protein